MSLLSLLISPAGAQRFVENYHPEDTGSSSQSCAPLCDFIQKISSQQSACSACSGKPSSWGQRSLQERLWRGSAGHHPERRRPVTCRHLDVGCFTWPAAHKPFLGKVTGCCCGGRKGRRVWQNEPATSINSSNAPLVFRRKSACGGGLGWGVGVPLSSPKFSFLLFLCSPGRRKLRLFPVSSW